MVTIPIQIEEDIPIECDECGEALDADVVGGGMFNVKKIRVKPCVCQQKIENEGIKNDQ